MAIRLVRTLEDGATVVRDDRDGQEFVLKPGQYARVTLADPEEQRALVERFVIANQAPPPPAEWDAAREQNQDATTGEAHQDAER